ncbi:uncharacterized protein LOC129398796 [Sorex araneus]|uniref:uncharacterized protein LOC129398796 n=1 Tax=Sorex araneus TaxID=42254 RepID=UPI0024335BF6|nr:uncharacterized protein LOC129398796 [Sorex araneus]
MSLSKSEVDGQHNRVAAAPRSVWTLTAGALGIREGGGRGRSREYTPRETLAQGCKPGWERPGRLRSQRHLSTSQLPEVGVTCCSLREPPRAESSRRLQEPLVAASPKPVAPRPEEGKVSRGRSQGDRPQSPRLPGCCSRPRPPLTHCVCTSRGAAQGTLADASPPFPFPLSLRKQKEASGLRGSWSPRAGKFRAPPPPRPSLAVGAPGRSPRRS